jgi:hypothetical protein
LTEEDWDRIENGLRLPALENAKPEEFEADVHLYWFAWRQLSHGRVSGYGVSGITFSEMRSWMDEYSITHRGERDLFISVITELDRHFLESVSDRLKRKSDPKGGKVGKNA